MTATPKACCNIINLRPPHNSFVGEHNGERLLLIYIYT